MAYQPFYEITDWQELPSQKTPINRPNLLHAENGIKEADKRIVQLDAKKAELSLVNLLVRSIVVDAKTGVITVTQQNGTVTTYDLDIEKVIANFDITDDNVLILTLADGTTKEVDLTKFVNTFSSTATISMSMKDRVVTAEIIDGSVTMDKLDAAIQGEFRQYMLDAQSARDSALQYQKFAKRYAIGDSEFVGSETDNAKYYYEQTKTNAEIAASNAQSAEVDSETATAQAAIASGMPEEFGVFGAQFFMGIPTSIFFMIIFLIIVFVLLNYTRFGRHVYAIGGNEESTMMSGVNVKKNLIWSYVVSGIGAGLAALILSSRLGTAHPTAGDDYLMEALATVYVGGTAFKNGEFNIAGTFVGAMIIGVLTNGLTLCNVQYYNQDIAKGLVIFLAVTITSIQKTRKK